MKYALLLVLVAALCVRAAPDALPSNEELQAWLKSGKLRTNDAVPVAAPISAVAADKQPPPLHLGEFDAYNMLLIGYVTLSTAFVGVSGVSLVRAYRLRRKVERMKQTAKRD